jgi:hypothetical protein
MSKTSFDNHTTSREFETPGNGFFRSAFGGNKDSDSVQSRSALRGCVIEPNYEDTSTTKEDRTMNIAVRDGLGTPRRLPDFHATLAIASGQIAVGSREEELAALLAELEQASVRVDLAETQMKTALAATICARWKQNLMCSTSTSKESPYRSKRYRLKISLCFA